MRRRQNGFIHIVGATIAMLAALDIGLGTASIARALRRRRIVDPAGGGELETSRAYVARLVRAVAPHALILALLVLGFLALLHFGPLKPIHEWL